MLIDNCPSKGEGIPGQLLPGRRERTASRTDFPCCAGLDHYNNDACYLHWHEEIEIVYITDGSLWAHVNGTRHFLQAGQGILVNTGVLHSYAESEGKNTTAVYLLFFPSLAGGCEGSVYWTKYIHPFTGALALTCVPLTELGSWHGEILQRAQRTVELMKKEADGFEIDVRTELAHILRIAGRHTKASGPVGARQTAETQAMRTMLAYMENNCGRDLRIGEVAGSAYLSPQSCLRLFQRFTAMSPKRYLLQVRLEKARRLLLETTLDIAAVGAECGFSDQSYFTKLFREHYGSPPGAFRRLRPAHFNL